MFACRLRKYLSAEASAISARRAQIAGVSSFAQSSHTPTVAPEENFEFKDNSDLYNDDYLTRQPVGTLPASAMYDESMMQAQKNPEIASRYAYADSTRISHANALSDRYYTRHVASHGLSKKQDFKVSFASLNGIEFFSQPHTFLSNPTAACVTQEMYVRTFSHARLTERSTSSFVDEVSFVVKEREGSISRVSTRKSVLLARINSRASARINASRLTVAHPSLVQ